MIRERRWLSQIGGDRQRNDALPCINPRVREPLPAEPAQASRLACGQMAQIDPTKGQGRCLGVSPCSRASAASCVGEPTHSPSR